jgi:hypothetical protein
VRFFILSSSRGSLDDNMVGSKREIQSCDESSFSVPQKKKTPGERGAAASQPATVFFSPYMQRQQPLLHTLWWFNTMKQNDTMKKYMCHCKNNVANSSSLTLHWSGLPSDKAKAHGFCRERTQEGTFDINFSFVQCQPPFW